MNRMLSKEIITFKKEGEYLNDLHPGDAFLSFHTSGGKCAGLYLHRRDVKTD